MRVFEKLTKKVRDFLDMQSGKKQTRFTDSEHDN